MVIIITQVISETGNDLKELDVPENKKKGLEECLEFFVK